STATADVALTIALALEPVLRARGPVSELLRVTDAALALEAGCPSPGLVARALVVRARLRADFGLATDPRSDVEHALRAARTAGDLPAQGRALTVLGWLTHADASRTESLANFEAAVKALRKAGDRRGEAHALSGLVWVEGTFFVDRLDSARNHADA